MQVMPSLKRNPSLSYSRLARKNFIIYARNFKLKLGPQTKIMGVVNVTPDSFSADGVFMRYRNDMNRISDYAEELIADGADMIDIGGESTRPGAKPVSETEEMKRVIPVIKHLSKKVKVPISVDTYKEKVAQNALDNGASIINNIMGVTMKNSFLKMIRRYHASIVLMHLRGNPRTMQQHTAYRNLVKNIIDALKMSIDRCLTAGILSNRIIIDPGIGFSKTSEQNLSLIRRLNEFSVLNQPILIGTSRKSFIGEVLKKETNDRLLGTIATVCASISHGAHIVRVHDVCPIKEIVLMMDAIYTSPAPRLGGAPLSINPERKPRNRPGMSRRVYNAN